MSVYTENLETHKIYTDLQNIQDELDIINQIEDKAPADVEALARIASVIKNFSVSLESCDKDYVAIAWLDEVSTALANIRSYLNTYKTNKDPNNLTTHSFGQLNTVLNNTVKLNCVKNRQNAVNGILKATEEYKKVLESYNEQLYKKVNLLNEEIEELRQNVVKEKQQMDKDISEFKNTINSEKQRLDGFASKYQDQMTADQKSFSELEENFKDMFNSVQEERKNAFDLTIENFNDGGTALIETYKKKFAEYQYQVENIVGIVNTNMFSHRYKAVADDAKMRSKNWHKLAIALMVLGAGFAIYTFVISLNEDVTWVQFAAKVFATTTIAYGAIYAARQATKQEKVERYARKIEMELVAIDPFIESLETEKQSEIKAEIARKIFGNSDAMGFNPKDEKEDEKAQYAYFDGLLNTILSHLPKN